MIGEMGTFLYGVSYKCVYEYFNFSDLLWFDWRYASYKGYFHSWYIIMLPIMIIWLCEIYLVPRSNGIYCTKIGLNWDNEGVL